MQLESMPSQVEQGGLHASVVVMIILISRTKKLNEHDPLL